MLLPTAPLVLLKAGAQGISIAVAIRSFDRTLQMYFSNRLLVQGNARPRCGYFLWYFASHSSKLVLGPFEITTNGHVLFAM